MPVPPKRLELNDLCAGFSCITPSWGRSLAECGSFCLAIQEHDAVTELALEGDEEARYQLNSISIDDQVRRTWADLQEATEWGACGIAILLVRDRTPFQVVKRSWKGTGFDYWLGEQDGEPPFEHKARLEVSGILRAEGSQLRYRANQKLKQVDQGTDRDLPAIIVVVDFGEPRSRMVTRKAEVSA